MRLLNVSTIVLLTVYQGKFYQLADNEDTEEWELHITGIDIR